MSVRERMKRRFIAWLLKDLRRQGMIVVPLNDRVIRESDMAKIRESMELRLASFSEEVVRQVRVAGSPLENQALNQSLHRAVVDLRMRIERETDLINNDCADLSDRIDAALSELRTRVLALENARGGKPIAKARAKK
jgi:hypothetical protein